MKSSLIICGGFLFLFGLMSPVLWEYFYWYTPFTIGGFLFLEGVNLPVFSVLRKPRHFFAAWLTLIALATMIEIIGNTWIDAWDYPGFTTVQYIVEVLVIGYPFVGFFTLELFALLQRTVRPHTLQYATLPIAILFFSYLNEIPNTYVYEWRYTSAPLGSLFNVPVHITMLWFLLFVLLPFTYVFTNRTSPSS